MVNFNSDVPEAERLANFVFNLRRLFIHCEDRQAELFSPEFRQSAVEMWPTLRRRTYELENALREFPLEERSKLIDAGLSGPELNVKLDGFNLWYHAFNTQVVPTEQAVKPQPISWWRRFRRSENAKTPTLKWLAPLKYALKWANITLGSLAVVIGGAEPLKELKEVVERGIDDGDARELPSTGNIIFNETLPD